MPVARYHEQVNPVTGSPGPSPRVNAETGSPLYSESSPRAVRPCPDCAPLRAKCPAKPRGRTYAIARQAGVRRRSSPRGGEAVGVIKNPMMEMQAPMRGAPSAVSNPMYSELEPDD